MLSVKQGGIKNHFFSLWYDSTWDWTPISQTIGDVNIVLFQIFFVQILNGLSSKIPLYINSRIYFA